MAATFHEMVTAQCNLLTHAAKRLDTSGYMVLVCNANKDGADDRFAYGHMTGGLTSLANKWAKAKNIELVTVTIWPHADSMIKVRQTGKVFDYPFESSVILKSVRRYKPIIAALELFSARLESPDPHERAKKLKGKKVTRYRVGQGVLTMKEDPDSTQFYGSGQPALRLIMQTLNMPEHRHLLTGGRFTVKGNQHYHMIGMNTEQA